MSALSEISHPEDFSDSYRRWKDGRCPCCAADPDWWGETPAKAIGEGVIMCGRCVENGHHQDVAGEPVVAAMLEAIALGARADNGYSVKLESE